VIIVDGFDLDGQASSLCTEKFYTHCYNALTDNGVMAVNLSENHRHHSMFITRMRNVFSDNVILVSAENCTNKIVFAVKNRAVVDNQQHSQKNLLALAAELDKQHPIAFRQMVERMITNRHNPLLKD
jgi:spermidine synthase